MNALDRLEVRDTVVRFLRGIADGGEPLSESTGLCYNMDEHIHLYALTNGKPSGWYYDAKDYIASLRKQAFEAWPEFSGDTCYPIKGRYGPNGQAYDEASNRGDMYADDWYGNARRRLAGFVADYFDKAISGGVV